MRVESPGGGRRARLSLDCPIDFEGAGPVRGDVGRLVALPERTGGRSVTPVRFDRSDAIWLVPSRYLELLD